MGKPTGFLEVERRDRSYAPAAERVTHWREFTQEPGPEAVSKQASRCMDCGIPFCHSGCPVNNLIPDWNELVRRDRWQAALDVLHRVIEAREALSQEGKRRLARIEALFGVKSEQPARAEAANV